MPRPLDLPQPSTAQLEPAPLELVVCQVRHNRNVAVGDATRALAVREDLSEAFGEALQVEEQAQQEIAFALGPGAKAPIPTSQESQRGWRLRTADGKWIVALLPDFYALESTGYTSWTDFQIRLDSVSRAVHAHLKPSLEMRIGLRYVDRISTPQVTEPSGWKAHIQPTLLGPLLHPNLGGSISGTQQVLEMEAPGGHRVLLRHGTQLDETSGTWPYILDTDCFDNVSRGFEPGVVLDVAQQLHRIALQVFQASVTPEWLERVSPGE